jgi:1-acyl-sn-glycerol-3-phosphate acyltransferase
MSALQISLAVFLAATAAIATPSLVRQWRAMRESMRLIRTCGHVPPPPTEAAARTMMRIARFVVWVQIGKIRVSGLEHLDCDTPRLIAPTHGHYVDPFVLAQLLPERARYMTAKGLLALGGGLSGLMLARAGAFCTDLDEGRGAPALRAAVRILASGQTLVMFPEGWANMDGVVRPFKHGPVSVARMGSSKAGRPVPIVPVYLSYRAYPGEWINRLPAPLQFVLVALCLVVYRRGVHVVFGKAVLSTELPKDAGEATAELRRAVLALNPRTPARGTSSTSPFAPVDSSHEASL